MYIVLGPFKVTFYQIIYQIYTFMCVYFVIIILGCDYNCDIRIYFVVSFAGYISAAAYYHTIVFAQFLPHRHKPRVTIVLLDLYIHMYTAGIIWYKRKYDMYIE